MLVIEFKPILLLILLTLVIGLILMLISYGLVPHSVDYEKNLSYECGFEPFEETRKEFEIKFYLIGVLFIIFDLELIFLLPAIMNFEIIQNCGWLGIFIFIILLTGGFVYEWVSGALDW
jgi:NADH-quinone oxidoreductase subunit A